jgi:hypothetical protein
VGIFRKRTRALNWYFGYEQDAEKLGGDSATERLRRPIMRHDLVHHISVCRGINKSPTEHLTVTIGSVYASAAGECAYL